MTEPFAAFVPTQGQCASPDEKWVGGRFPGSHLQHPEVETLRMMQPWAGPSISEG